MELTIYNRNGQVKKIVSPDSTSSWTEEVGVEFVVSVNFTTWDFFVLSVGDYILVDGKRFSIKKEYRPKQANTQKYTYNINFYSREHDMEDILFCRLNHGDNDLESVFSYDGTPGEFLQKLVDNMNRNTSGGIWRVGEAIVADRQNINFNSMYCWDAAAEIAKTFETEWWMDGEYLNFSKCQRGERVELGYMEGLKSGLSQQENTNAIKWFTRLIPVGSSINIDPSVYGYATLQLPSREKYIDLNTNLGLKEYREEAAFAGIFPHRTGTLSATRSEEKTNEETGDFTVYYVSDDELPFNPDDYMLFGEVINITFKSGALIGKTFECNWHNATSEFEIINTYPDDNIQIPGGNLIPAVGDTYVLTNIRMPESYYSEAEEQYKLAVDDFLKEYSKDVSIYSGETDYIYVDENDIPLHLGQRIRLKSTLYFDEGYRDSRITRVTRKLNNLGEATIECTNSVNTSWKSSVENSINNLQYTVSQEILQSIVRLLKTGDRENPSDYTAYSSLRSLEMFLRKNAPDTVEYVITFLQGLITGDWSQGSTGVGIYKDDAGNWHIETDYLDVRMKFTAKEVEIQKVFHIGGSEIKSSASMKCIRVEELDDVYRCYMNTSDGDGQVIYNQFKVNDQAYVQTFNLERQADGTVGNHFFWRLVTAVGPDYIDLSKAVCALASDAPKAFDDIVQLGYRGTDDPSRQVAVIDAGAGEGAPYYRQYVGINSFHLPEPETQLKPGDNKLSGVVHIEKGSTGAGNLSDLPDFIQQAQQMGTVNLLRNSGFTGDYETEELNADTELTEDTEMYSKALEFWTGMATVQEDATAVSGRSAVIGSLSQSVALINQELYVISYQAKGESVAVSCGDFNMAQPLTSEYKRYKHSFTFSGAGIFMLSGTATVCDVQLERGTIATDWKPSPLDNDKSMAEFQSLSYIYDVLKNGSVDIIGGLILSNMIQLGNYQDGKMKRVTAGISGIYNDEDDVYTWGGGTFEQAIRTVMKYKNNPKYQPTEEELKTMANAVITHGGRAILNDVILRGYVYALGGMFKGTVEIADGKILLNEDGSGQLADGTIYWDSFGRMFQKSRSITVWRNIKKEMDEQGISGQYDIDFHGGTYLDITKIFTDNRTINLPSASETPDMVLDMRVLLISRLADVYSVSCLADGGIKLYNPDTKTYDIVQSIYIMRDGDTGISEDTIESIKEGEEYHWYAGRKFTANL